MCGIFGFTAQREIANVQQFLLNGLQKLEYRGYDSAGIAYKEGDTINIIKAVGKLEALESKINSINPSGNLGFAHTRWATHGKVTEKNAHPHHDCQKEIAIVHNGIIENYLELKKELHQKGHKFYSETDTEVFAHLVEEALASAISKAKLLRAPILKELVREAFLKLKGLNAFIVAHKNVDALIGIKNGSPLVVGIGGDIDFIASDVIPFLGCTRKIIPLEDNQGIVLGNGKAAPFDVSTGKSIPLKTEEITWDEEQAQKGNYPHFLLKEICEQGDVLRKVSQISDREIKRVAALIKKAYGVYFTACGTASYACLAATYMFSDIAKRHVNFAVGSEFYFLEEFLTPRSLLFALSQSGETADTLEAVRAAKKHHSKVVALVNVLGSSLTRLADEVIYLRAGPEKAVLSTKAFTAKLALILLLAHELAGKSAEGKKLLSQAAKAVDSLVYSDVRSEIKRISAFLAEQEHLYVIGRGVNYPIALEAALKIKEASYLHAEGFAGGELKHGVIALIEKRTPCLVLVANDEAKSSVLVNAAELKLRGAYIIGIAPENNEVFDEWLPVPDMGAAAPIINTIPAQLFGYYVSIHKNLDPDRPRNLAKSVTVK